VYTRPTQEIKLRNYVFDAFGPYPIVSAAVFAGVGQIDNTPAAWKQGGAGYGKRFGSGFGIAAITTTTRYALAEAFKEDTLYYRCECKGISTVKPCRGFDRDSPTWPGRPPRLLFLRLHSALCRNGDGGVRLYPDNYGARYALRLGNYNLLEGVGENIMLEFFYSGPHSLLSRMHLNNTHAAPDPGSK